MRNFENAWERKITLTASDKISPNVLSWQPFQTKVDVQASAAKRPYPAPGGARGVRFNREAEGYILFAKGARAGAVLSLTGKSRMYDFMAGCQKPLKPKKYISFMA